MASTNTIDVTKKYNDLFKKGDTDAQELKLFIDTNLEWFKTHVHTFINEEDTSTVACPRQRYKYMSAIVYCVRYNCIECVKILLDYSNCINSSINVLAHAVSVECIDLLLKYAVDSNRNVNSVLEDFNGFTALYLADLIGNRTGVELLLKRGADINITNNCMTPILHSIIDNDDINNDDINNGDINNGDIHMIELLLKHGADVNVTNGFGYTPLHYAIINGKNSIAELLLKHGATVTIDRTIQCGIFDDNTITTVMWLIEHGVDVTHYGNRPLQCAIRRNNIEAINVFTKRVH